MPETRTMAAVAMLKRCLTKPRTILAFSSSFPPPPIRGPLLRFISTLVVAEHDGGFVKQSSLSAVAAAAAVNREKSVTILLGGSGPSLHKAADHAASCHPLISQVLVADSDILVHPLAETWAELVRLVQHQGGYSHIISTSNSFGKNLLPRAAALLDVSPITDVTEISEQHLFTRPIYAGNALCTVRYTGADPCMITIRATSFTLSSSSHKVDSDGAPISQVDLSNFDVDSGSSLIAKYLGNVQLDKFKTSATPLITTDLSLILDTERPDLGNARIVVTGGRGLKSAENFKLLEKLAEKLGAAVGATRAAVDARFVPNDLQVGQTGKIVAPELYIAFGVSGAIQHLAGMRDSKVIVAVNKDADAPIFQIADYGLVADLFDVIPELIEKLPNKE